MAAKLNDSWDRINQTMGANCRFIIPARITLLTAQSVATPSGGGKARQACGRYCRFRLDGREELRPEWFRGKEKVGVIGANETPDWMVDQAIKKIKSMAA
jgi:hypothetical protein